MPHCFTAAAALLAAFTLAGCSDDQPSASALAHQRERAEHLASFQANAPFSLHCRGSYSLTVNDKTSEGTQSFSVSVAPDTLELYMFGFEADGYLHGPHRGMNDKVVGIDRVDADVIGAGVLRIDRRTLRYESAATLGKCTRRDGFMPIPRRAI